MCSIFHNRINYRGPRNGGNGTSATVAKDIDPDRNNNSGEITKTTTVAAMTPTTVIPIRNGTPDIDHHLKEHSRHLNQINQQQYSYQNHLNEPQNSPHPPPHEVDDDQDADKDQDSNEALDLSMISPRLPATGHVALEVLQHTKVAVAQFAATAIANSQNYDEAVNDLAVVQSTIFNVQRQQLMQLQLIQHLQTQLKQADKRHHSETDEDTENDNRDDKETLKFHASDEDAEDVDDEDCAEAKSARSYDNLLRNLVKVKEKLKTESEEPEKNGESNGTPTNPEASERSMSIANVTNSGGTNSSSTFQPHLCDISSSLASSIITNHDPPPPPNEPNCLEMLQRRTEEVLDSASQSLHANNLQEEFECSQKDAQARGEIFKHRCKYCGKIFGSYSALQIHLRSHTGERPFHCNVCGSKFTTKGNLKVHYQRHTQIFPPMLMPPAGVSSIAGGTDHYGPFHSAMISTAPSETNGPIPIRLSFPPHGEHMHHEQVSLERRREEIQAEIKLESARQAQSNNNQSVVKVKEEILLDEPQPESEPEPLSHEENRQNFDEPEDLRKCAVAEPKQTAKNINNEPLTMLTKVESPRLQIETLQSPSEKSDVHSSSKRSGIGRKRNCSPTETQEVKKLQPSMADDHERDHRTEPESLPKIFQRSSVSRGSTASIEHISSEFSLAQMEKIIDKSWEDLIEIDKTSETSKLQQLVDNIENKLTDPNQCIFCQKVMSCRSSLQMHIRTHTGERPYRCRICGRAFATKGNLKAHMSIHKIKPPMRSQFKCPVCHQKFSNGIILQQHIRIHTLDDGGAESAEHNARLKASIEAQGIEDQSSNKSMGTSDNLDFSTSEYSGQRSESSQGDFDDFMTMASEEESPENSNSLIPLERRGGDDIEKDRRRADVTDVKNFDYAEMVMDLSSRTANSTTSPEGSCGGNADKNAENSPAAGVTVMPPNFLLMAAARDEVNQLGHQKFPLLPFSPLGIMGLPPNANICSICFKLFPNQSALEIHCRTQHTKESSLNRSICDTVSSFNAKINLNSQLFARKVRSGEVDNETDATRSNQNPSIFLRQDDDQMGNRQSSFKKEHFKLEDNSDSDQNQRNLDSQGTNLSSSPYPHGDAEQSLMKMQLLSSLPNESQMNHSSESSRFTPNTGHHQQQQQQSQDYNQSGSAHHLEPPINNKHFCTICRRNFSSSSALQIHMRTHTGDKPFQCNVCQKAFTTKGNLKVHMGTHMWTNPTSRRGRRMSLELPMHRPGSMGGMPSPQDSEFLQRRPEIFFPYLPPFFSGLPPKPGEPGAYPNIPPPPFPNGAAQKYSSLLGFPPFLGPPYNLPGIPNHEQHSNKSPSPSPSHDKHSESPHREGIWNSPPCNFRPSSDLHKHKSPESIQNGNSQPSGVDQQFVKG